MKRIHWAGLALAGAGGLVAAAAGALRAAEHRDAPAVRLETQTNADINDVYTWMSSDASRLNAVMTVEPFAAEGAMFSDAVQYVFHVHSAAAYGESATETRIICTFDAAQQIECWAGAGEYVTGDAGAAGGVTSASGRLRVFAGLRNDPFFFNLNGFNETVTVVKGAAASLTFDDDGCPALDEGTATALVTQLQSEPGGAAAVDDFAGANTLAIVVSVDKTLVTPGGPIASVWASTHASP
jgi:hypothetical protein